MSIVKFIIDEIAKRFNNNKGTPGFPKPELDKNGFPKPKVDERGLPQDWKVDYDKAKENLDNAATAIYEASNIKGFVDLLQKIYDMKLNNWKTITQFVKDVSAFMTNVINVANTSRDTLGNLYSLALPFAGLKPALEMMTKAIGEMNDCDVGKIIQEPNLDVDAANELARMLAVPYLGDVLKNQIELAWMSRYQKIIGRGFPTALDQLRYLVSGGMSPINMMNEMNNRMPDFMLDNQKTAHSNFDIGFKEAFTESKKHRPIPKVLKVPKLP